MTDMTDCAMNANVLAIDAWVRTSALPTTLDQIVSISQVTIQEAQTIVKNTPLRNTECVLLAAIRTDRARLQKQSNIQILSNLWIINTYPLIFLSNLLDPHSN